MTEFHAIPLSAEAQPLPPVAPRLRVDSTLGRRLAYLASPTSIGASAELRLGS